MNIVIKGGYGLKNFGDDALMMFVCKMIGDRYPDADIFLDCKKDDYVKSLCDVEFWSSDISRVDYLVYGGGTLYYDFPKTLLSFLRKLMGSVFRPWIIARWFSVRFYKSDSIEFKRKVMLGVGFGPFHDPNGEKAGWARKAISETDYVVARDSASLAFSQEVNARSLLGADICYMDYPEVDAFENRSKEIKSIAIIIRDWNNNNEGDGHHLRFEVICRKLEEKGFSVHFLIFSPLSDVKVKNYLNSIGANFTLWDPEYYSAIEFLKLMSDFDLIISSRFHGLVFATRLAIPSVSIAIEPKLVLANENSVCEIWHPVKDSDEALFGTIEKISDDYDKYKEKCRSMVLENRKKMEKAVEFAFSKGVY